MGLAIGILKGAMRRGGERRIGFHHGAVHLITTTHHVIRPPKHLTPTS